MKVAVVYNLSHSDLEHYKTEFTPKELDFEPYFDVESCNPLEGYHSIRDALIKVGYEAYCLNLFDDYNAFLADYKINCPEIIFNMVEIYRDKAYLEMSFASLLEMMKVPYTGAPPLALGVCQRKIMTKSILSSLEIRTPKFQVITRLEELSSLKLNYPIIVKPSMEDASLGIEDESVVSDMNALKRRVQYVLNHFRQNVLLEEFIDGRELNVAVLGDKNPRVLPISEIDFSEMPAHLNNIVSYQAKWDPFHEAYHMARPICPAILPLEVEKEAKDLALRAFKALGCRDYARVDMRLSKDNKLYVLEANPNPDLTEDAGFMRSSRASGLSFRRTLRKIVEFAWSRREEKRIMDYEL